MQTERRIRKRNDYVKRWQSLQNERESWIQHYRDLSQFLLPRQGRFFVTDTNQGGRRDQELLDSTATYDVEVAAAGMKAGASSSARPWFRLTTSDPALAERHAVRVWLDKLTQQVLRVFARSNTYEALYHIYSELLVFGTGASILVPRPATTIHHMPLTAGEYAIAQDFDGKVNTLYREFQRTVAEVVEEFGYEQCSEQLQNRYQHRDYDGWVTLLHVIEPRRDSDRDPAKLDNRNMPWRSCYVELHGKSEKILRETGFRDFPALVPRWRVAGGDIYGHSPGMNVLGDVMGLQALHEEILRGVQFQVRPPTQGPSSLLNQSINRLPGGHTYNDQLTEQNSIRPLWDVNLNLQHAMELMLDHRARIDRGLFRDLFQMLSSAERDPRMTAFEVAIRQEEKLTILGPVLDRVHNELLEPLVDRTLAALLEGGISLPDVPPELEGQELNIEFVSMLAQAQKAIDTNSIDRFVANLGTIAQWKPDVLDKFDADKWADQYSDMLGVPPELIVPGERVAIVRKARADAEAAMKQSEVIAQQAKAARDLGATPTGGDPNAFTDVLGQFSGLSSPSALDLAGRV